MGRLIIFGRTKKETKLKSLEEATPSELLGLPEEVFYKILQKAGEPVRRGSRKLSLPSRPGNDWNSEVESIYTWKGKIWLEIYHQLSHTDTTLDVRFSDFLSTREWRGISYETDKYGTKTPRYCVYSPGYKAEVIREILRTYIS